MIKEFTTEQLYDWRAKGVRFIGVSLYRPELMINEDTDEFMVAPFMVIQDAEMFLLEQAKNELSPDVEPPHYLPIDSGEAYEIAAGVSGCMFYFKASASSKSYPSGEFNRDIQNVEKNDKSN